MPKIQAVISLNPMAEAYNEIEQVDTFDFTPCLSALKSLVQLAKFVKAHPAEASPIEEMMAECVMQIALALRLEI